MHLYSFDLRDPVFALGPWKLSFQVITLENLYGLDAAHTTLEAVNDGWRLACSRLSWAGQQRHAPGSLEMYARREGEDRLLLDIRATAPHKIRAVKVLIRDLPPLRPLDMLDNPRDLPEGGLIDAYPNPLRLPLFFGLLPDGTVTAVRSEDPYARAKRFAVYRENFGPLAGTCTVECLHEQDARWFDTRIDVPLWVLERGVDVPAFREEQLAFDEAELGLAPWEQRGDVPRWARDLRLCLTIHQMHWSGYIFNTYAQALDIIRFVADRIDGRHVLAYLPGWEGRYYWQYGDYRPEPLLGGGDGFARLCDGARALGVHVMPMFGVNCANAWAPNFHTFGPSSYMKSATRNTFWGNQPDWDLKRAHDTGWQAWLHPGAPAWQTELTRQIRELVGRFGFDGVFLDTTEVWVNDPDFNMREGLRQLNARLRAGHPELLVAGEDWYDGLLPILPVFQQTATWRQVPEWVGRYARLIGHICDGDPSRNSTGVHEAGCSPYVRLPQTETYIPTLTFVDGTLEEALPEIEAVIAQAAAGRGS